MRNRKLACSLVLTLSLLSILLPSCYKTEIKFGNELIVSDSRLIEIDTVTPVLSTYLLDSFTTNGSGRLFVGRVIDPYMGTVTASSYFQFGLPTKSSVTEDISASNPIYDSLVLYMKPDSTHYGDTTKLQTFSLLQLAYEPQYIDNSNIYNTSSVAVATSNAEWGSKTVAYRPMWRDTIAIRLSDTKGQELWNKIMNRTNEVQNETYWLSYLKGFVLKVADADNGAIYSIPISDSSIHLRLHYHVRYPDYAERRYEFPLTRTGYQFNRIIADRTGTSLVKTYNRQKLYPATTTYPYSFTQAGTGALLKVTFPSLRNVLTLASTVRLLDAKLIIRPIKTSWSEAIFPLPSSLYLAQTDETDAIGSALTSSSGSSLSSAPIIDDLYHEDDRYEYNVTSYINYLLTTSGTENNGVFILQETAGQQKYMHRAVIGSPGKQTYKTELKITVMALEDD